MDKFLSPIINVRFSHKCYKRKKLTHIKGRDFCSLTYRKSGRVYINSCGNTFVSEPNMITYVPEYADYDSQIYEDGEMYILHFKAQSIGSLELGSPVAIPAHNFLPLFEQGHNSYTKGDYLKCFSLAYEILSMFQQSVNNFSKESTNLNKVKDYIDNNYINQGITVKELASMFGGSEVYFRKEFKKHYHSSPLNYIIKRRLEYAASLLASGEYNVSEAALSSGFDNPSYFSAKFGKHYGMTPTEYIKNVCG